MPLKKSELYSSLWASCDELRGGMDASQYKDYVLVLLFVKYVSDKAASQKNYLLDVPKGGSFGDMVALKGDKEIGDKINKIIAKLAEANDLKGVIDVADFNDADKLGKGKEMVDRLTNLVSNLPRYIDSTEPEDLQDIDAHLRGGIPNCDIDALERYWQVIPGVRAALFKKAESPSQKSSGAPSRTGYSQLRVAVAASEQALEETAEEHGGEEGLLAEAKNEKDKLTKASVAARLKEIKGDADATDERKVLNAYLALIEKEAATSAKLKDAQETLLAKVAAQ